MFDRTTAADLSRRVTLLLAWLEKWLLKIEPLTHAIIVLLLFGILWLFLGPGAVALVVGAIVVVALILGASG